MLDFRANWRYDLDVDFTWDPAKRLTNIAKHGVDFITAYGMDWSVAVVRADTRQNSREVRLRAIVPLDERLYFVTYTIRTNKCRVISARKANNREIKFYAHQV